MSIGIPITSPEYWASQCDDCMSEAVKHVFRSVCPEKMPLLEDRIGCLREAGQILNGVRSAEPICDTG